MARTGATGEIGCPRSLRTPGDPMDLNQVTVPALDVSASVAFYRRLGLARVPLVHVLASRRSGCPEGD